MENNFNRKAFIIQNKNVIELKESTAGGAFTCIAKQIIAKGGVVYGGTLDANLQVIHQMASSKDELRMFRNSKYVQSHLGDIFKDVKQNLDNGVLVCFSGTPCQVLGLKNYLGKCYDNLLLVDVCCRAVPSPGVWKRYTEEILNETEKVIDVRFRDKDLGYQYSTLKIKYEDLVMREGIESDYWLRMFFSGTIIRPSCTNCNFRDYRRSSDITIWDCLNLHDYKTGLNETAGATRVLVHTEKGFNYINNISDAYVIEISVESAVKNVKEFVVSPERPAFSELFWKDYKILALKDLIKKYYPINYRIKIRRFVRRFLNKIGADVYVKRLIRHN